MNQKLCALALAAVTAFSVSAMTVSAAATDESTQQAASEATERTGRHGKKQKTAAPENAIGKDAAKEAALKDAGVTEEQAGKVRARVSKTEDGTVIYKVRFSAADKWYSYQIDALTGSVIDHTEQSAEEHAAEKENARKNKSDTTDEENGTVKGKPHGKKAGTKSDAAEENGTESEKSGRKGGKQTEAAKTQEDTTI